MGLWGLKGLSASLCCYCRKNWFPASFFRCLAWRALKRVVGIPPESARAAGAATVLIILVFCLRKIGGAGDRGLGRMINNRIFMY